MVSSVLSEGRALWGRLEHARANGAYDRFVSRTERWMLGLAVGFLVVLLWPILDHHIPAHTLELLHYADVTIWLIFVVEYCTRLLLAPARWQFVRTHIPDLIVVLVPPLRGFRLLIVLRMVRLLGVVSMAGRLSRQSLHVRTGTYTLGLATGVLLAGAATVYEVEHDQPNANITSLGDGLWWALTTMTTVGYGDRFPVTVEGRLLAAFLMLSGMAVLGVLTASIAAWFVGQFHAMENAVEDVERSVEEVTETVEEIAETVDEFEDRIAASGSGNAADREELLATLRAMSDRLASLEQAVSNLTAADRT